MTGVQAPSTVRFLLDEQYPPWLAEELTRRGIDAEAVAARSDLRGHDDIHVLKAASAESRIVVTEDVSTFSAAIAAVPGHAGVIYCHHSRFPRSVQGLTKLEQALVTFAGEAPQDLLQTPFVRWLSS